MRAIDTALLWITRIGVFLVPFVPLIVAASLFFPFITGKNFAFRIITEIIFAAWLLLLLRRTEFRPKQSWLLWGVAAFLGIIFAADLFGENPFKAFWSNFERMEGFITLIHLGAYLLVASSVLDTEKLWHRFFATSVGVSAFLGIYGILQLMGKIVINQGGVRLDGTLGNAAYFAGYMLFHIFLTLFLILRHRTVSWVKWLYGGAVLLQIFTLIFTSTRGAFLGLVAGALLAACLIAVFERENKRLRTYFAVGGIILLVAVSVLFAAKERIWIKGNPVLTRFASISLDAAGPRFMVWGMAWEGFKERPLLGWGQEGFNYAFNKYYDPGLWAQEQWFDRTHNIFFDWLISAGMLGLLAYLSLFAVLLWYLWRGTPADGAAAFSFAEKSALTALLTGYVIHNFFVFDNLISYILFFSLIAYMHGRHAKPIERFERLPVIQDTQRYALAGAAAFIILAGGIYFLNVRGIMVSRYLIEGLRSQERGVTENLVFYKKAFAFETIGAQETAEQAIQAALMVAAAPSVPQALKEEFVAFSVEAVRREIERAPSDARLRMFIGGFLNRFGRFADALPHLETAHALSPSKQTIAFELANTYLSTGKHAEALALLKGAFERAPEFAGARTAYAAGAVYAGRFDIAEELLPLDTPHITALIDHRLVQAYFFAKRYGTVIAILKRAAAFEPGKVQTRVSLAAAYLANGNRAEAILELQKAIELNPAFKEQGEYYISEIRAGRNP